MQINRIIPLIMGIINGPKEVNKPASNVEFSKLIKKGLKSSQKTIIDESTGILKENQTAQQAQTKTAQPLPEFLPMPLKTPLYSQSGFFIKNQKDKTNSADNSDPTEVFIYLKTENIGILWISLSALEDLLKIVIYTEKEQFTEQFKEILPTVTEGLRQLGYPSVMANSITRPGITNCAEISSSEVSSQFYLIDWEV